LVGALLLQIGANLANDVFDFEKGADTAERLGPTRAVQAGLLPATSVRRALFLVFGLALCVGVLLTLAAGPWILLVGIASILSALAYTGGPYPLGYHGLGDLFVMIFFGLVAVCGTTFVQTGTIPPLSLWAALPVGSLATAILVVNNLRDRETDVKAGKRTLAVRFGRRGAIAEYALLVALAYAVPVVLAFQLRSLALLAPLVTLPLALRATLHVSRDTGRALNPWLVATAKLVFLHGVAFAAGIAWSAR
jgi:1,4-dihydroxy-2-naphthoate polyprenyltransferase